MGLDMYLHRKFYVQNWSHHKPEDKWTFRIKRGGKPYSGIPTDKITYIETTEIYWRKANAIHDWFVKNCQDGHDDCREAYVDREQLRELLGRVEEVLEDHRLAESLLPTSDGFFFGSKDYDEYYFEDLEHTKKELTRLLNDGEEKGDFYYHSSW